MNAELGVHVHGGDDIAREALEVILGERFLKDAVDDYVRGSAGDEVILSILSLLRPFSAMKRCYEIYRSDANIETRRYALTLLAHVADHRVFSWVHEFLEDSDEDINVAGTWILERMLWAGAVPPVEFSLLLEQAEQHRSRRVQEQVRDLRIREQFENAV